MLKVCKVSVFAVIGGFFGLGFFTAAGMNMPAEHDSALSMHDSEQHCCSGEMLNAGALRILEQLRLTRTAQGNQAEQVFGLQQSIEKLREEIKKKEADLDVLARRSDYDRQARALVEDLARELEKGSSISPVFTQMDRPFFIYLRDQACFADSKLILQKLLEQDPAIRSDLQALGLFALTDDTQGLMESADKMELLASLGVDFSQIRSVDSLAHALVRESSLAVVEVVVKKQPELLYVRDTKGRDLCDIAVERYIQVLPEKGIRSREYDEAYKMLAFLLEFGKLANISSA